VFGINVIDWLIGSENHILRVFAAMANAQLDMGV
jgi:hypothetical protein